MKIKYNSVIGEVQPATRHSLGWCSLALFLALVWTGCKQDPKVPADINPAGIYTLVSVDGKQVPCALTHEGTTATIKSGAFTITGDGACSSKITFSMPPQEDMSREVKAAWTREGTKLTMKWEGAGVTTGDIEGNTFTMNNEGMVLIYRK